MEDTQMKEFEVKMAEAISGGIEKHVPNIVNKAVDEKIQAEVKRLGLDKIDLKHGNFPTIGQADEAAKLSKKERFASFIKAIFRKDMAKLAELNVKGMTEGTDSQGGYLVPEELVNEIDRIVGNYGLIRTLSRKIPMKRDAITLPTLDAVPTVSWAGELVEGTDGSPTLKGVKLTAKTAIGLSAVSNELLADADASISDLLLDLFGEALAKEEDKQGLIGTGAPFTGIMQHADVNLVTAISDHDAFSEITLDDLRDTVTAIKEGALMGSCWVMHREIWAMLQKILEGSQHVLMISNNPNLISMKPEGGLIQPMGYLWGYPVYTSDHMPAAADTGVSTKMCLFGNFKYFYFGNRQETSMAISQDASIGAVNAFASNSSIVRTIERCGLAVGVPDAFAVLRTYS